MLDFILRFLAMAEFEQAHSAHMANENVSILAANHNFQLSTFNSQLFYSSVTPQFSVSSTRCAFSIVRNVPFTPVGSPLTVYE